MKTIAGATLCLILLSGCTGPAITEAQALETASEHLASLSVPHEGRATTISLSQDVYTVTYLLPEGWLGGDFVVRVSADSGDVLDVTLWR